MLSTDFSVPETQLSTDNVIIRDDFLSQDTQTLDDLEPADGINNFTRIWMREHEAPELLSYEETAVNYIFATIQGQRDCISAITTGPDASLLSNLLSLELRRLTYLVNSYLRMRLEKLVKHAYYYKTHEVEKQSVSENQFIVRFINNFEADLRVKFLDKLPAEFASFPPNEDELENGISFDDAGPNLEQHVVCSSRIHVNGFIIDDYGGTTDLEPGTILCLPYRFVKDIVRRKQVDLV